MLFVEGLQGPETVRPGPFEFFRQNPSDRYRRVNAM